MPHKKIASAKKKVRKARKKRDKNKLKRSLWMSRKREGLDKKKQKAKQKARSATAPARIEAKASKKELGELKQELKQFDIPGSRTAKRAASATRGAAGYAAVAGDAFDDAVAVDQDRDGDVEADELVFWKDLDGDGTPDRGEFFDAYTQDDPGRGGFEFEDLLIDTGPRTRKRESSRTEGGSPPEFDDFLL